MRSSRKAIYRHLPVGANSHSIDTACKLAFMHSDVCAALRSARVKRERERERNNRSRWSSKLALPRRMEPGAGRIQQFGQPGCTTNAGFL